MTTYATGNPLGSKGPRDLYDNAENFDAAMNDRVNTTWNDRFGVTRPTLKGYEEQFNSFLAGSGFENPPLIYVDGSPLTVDRATQIIDRGGNLYSVKLPSSFPVVLSGNWPEDEGLLVVRGDQSLRQEITSISPSEGSSIIGNSTVSVSSVADIKNQTKRADLKLSLSSYHPLGKSGGGTFIWSPSTPKSNHDGGTIFSPTVPWDGSQSTLSDYLDGEGETDPSGSGCWLRIFDEVKLEYFGGLISETIDSSASFLAAIKYCLSNNKELNLPDGAVRLNSHAVINGSTTLFSSVKIRGTFKTSGVSAGYVVNRVGSLIYTDGNSALDISFNDFRNENFDIRGVAFVDTSFYPPGTPASPNPAIIIRKGNPDGSSNRYITGNVLEDVAFVSYQDPIKTIGVAAGLPAYNYVGPTSLNRVYFYRCGTVMHLQDCTYNHLFMNECLLFDISSQAIFLSKTDSGTGGNVVVTFNNCVFESIWGIMNTANGLTSSSMRNTAVFNSCNREFCGLYGPTGGGGDFAGSPLGYVGHTDIMINGNWERGQAFGETTLPAIDPGAVIFASRYVDVIMNGGQVGSPEYVNVVDVSGTIPASGSLTKTFNVSGSFVLNADVAYDDGFGGDRRHAIARPEWPPSPSDRLGDQGIAFEP
ncbi:hypothetical protein [Pseudomonas aeruginosa]|uniref:hypothetical protein n=1 Tax=Pseudomonas aeruginosa TaxID=287 RepID=UPI0039F66B62